MTKGTIKWKNEAKGFGFIVRKDAADCFFHLSQLRGVKFEALKEGDHVEFEVQQGKKGWVAVDIRLDQTQDSPSTTNEGLQSSADQASNQNHFLNPYNFVRFLPKAHDGSTVDNVTRALLSRCPPPPHDRYVGLSGSINCRLTALSPLFISDAHDVRSGDAGATVDHKSFRFFRLGDQYAIPGSSLRGMVRSVFEMVTGSCMMHMDGSTLQHRVRKNTASEVYYIKEDYKASRDHLLSKIQKGRFKGCTHSADLCPACRTFGWVSPSAKKNDAAVQSAYRGRVRFSHAMHNIMHGEHFAAILAILSSPKPTKVPFYLLHTDNSPPSSWNDRQLQQGYDGNVELRGRKVYRRPKDSDLQARNNGKHEYERIDGTADIQNRTVRDALPKDNEFEFSVDFDNLSRLELGALLWSLELENDWAHRLGYAKPLGFGSVNNTIVEVQLRDAASRYTSLSNDGTTTWAQESENIQNAISYFKDMMKQVYDKEFLELETLCDLSTLLGPQDETLPPIHYPRQEKIPNAKGEGFRWHTDKVNKKRGLQLAADDKKGLPHS